MIISGQKNSVDKKTVDKEKKYIVALSGGADSVCLLLKMLDEGRHVEAAHCNFHLRGAESDRDESFVVSLCSRLGVPLHRAHFDTREYASLHKVSIEMAARTLRYDYFEKLRCDIGAEAILVAHHRDDNVETVLMNMVRGTGIRGVAGIRPRNGHILRPLLDMSRSDIEAYLRERGETYVTDSTNLEDEATRNKFRLNVIPLLRTINPRASENIHSTSKHLAEAERIVEWAVSMAREEIITSQGDDLIIDVPRLEAFVSPEYLLNDICRDYGFSTSQIADMSEAIREHHVGAVFSSATHIAAVANINNQLCIQISKNIPDQSEYKLPEEGIYNLSSTLKVIIKSEVIADDFVISKSADCATLDYRKVAFPLTLRTIREGDRFTPFGMKGSKLVSDYLTDIKCSVIDKRRQQVVVDATGTIVWLVGRRTSDKCRIDATSTTALVISLKK